MIAIKDRVELNVQLTPKLSLLLSYSKEKLYPLLISGYVASVWWDIDETSRRELALNIINWWGTRTIYKVRYQLANEWIERPPGCTGNSAIRYAIFADSSLARPNEYYWYNDKWHELINEPCFHLPAICAYIDSGLFHHSLAALQIKENSYDFNSWIFFQYAISNIVPSDSQMPVPGKVSAFIPWEICVHGFSGPAFVVWKI